MVLIGFILNDGELPVGAAFTAADVDSNGSLDISVRRDENSTCSGIVRSETKRGTLEWQSPVVYRM